jgi:urease alpha subunit
MVSIARRDYAALYGPTVGDGVRLADTSLIAVVEKDHAVYGDECLHGGGKTLRDGIGLAAGVTSAQGALDLLLCNVLVIDPVIGIVEPSRSGHAQVVMKVARSHIMSAKVRGLLRCHLVVRINQFNFVRTVGGVKLARSAEAFCR